MSRVFTKLHNNPHSEEIIAVSIQDCDDILAYNHLIRGENRAGDGGKLKYSIPLNVLNMWLYEEWTKGNHSLRLYSAEFDELVKRKMQDSDWKNLKV